MADKPPWHKTLRNTAFRAVLSRADIWWMTAIYWPDFPTFTYPSSIWRPQWGGSPGAIGFTFGVGKLKGRGYNLVKVAWWSTRSFGHDTSTWQTHRQPRRHSKCSANALASGSRNLSFEVSSRWPRELLFFLLQENNIPFIETSAKSGKNVNFVFVDVAKWVSC